jgi:UDP:flavonoid glycosyltransferase YjiC (YdhE family)
VRVLFSVSGWRTHYLAMVPIGWALQAAGHDVRVLCPPSQAEHISHCGLAPVPAVDGLDMELYHRLMYLREAAAGRWPFPWLPLHPVTGAALHRIEDFDEDAFRRDVEPAHIGRATADAERAVALVRAWRPDLVLHDPVSTEGLLAARVTGTPAVLCLWGPVGTAEPAGLRLLPHDLGGVFGRHAGELDTGVVEHVADPCPPSLAPPTLANRLPTRFVPYNGPVTGQERPLGRPARPRVCVTWSTTLSRMSGPQSYILPRLLRTLAALDVEVVVTATAADVAHLGTLPQADGDRIRIVTDHPLRLILPSCAAVIHHGGAGSALTAVAHGVPQLAVTFAPEQIANGTRIAATGAGLHALGHDATGPVVRDLVRRLVEDPVHRDAARRLRAELDAKPSPARLVPALERLAHNGSGRGARPRQATPSVVEASSRPGPQR